MYSIILFSLICDQASIKLFHEKPILLTDGNTCDQVLH